MDDKDLGPSGEEYDEEDGYAMEEDGILVGDHQVVGDAFPLEEGDDEWTDCDEDDALDDAEDGMSEDDELQPTDGEDDVDELGLGRRDMGEAAAEGEEAETYTAFEVLESAPLDHAFYGETTTTTPPPRAFNVSVRDMRARCARVSNSSWVAGSARAELGRFWRSFAERL